MKCRRCDWQPEGDDTARDELAQHARDAAHPLCILGVHSLTDFEPVCCEQCLDRTRDLLKRTVELYALLPMELGHAATQVYDRGSRSADGPPLPGGAALVMLGPGSPGAFGSALTESDADPVSVAHALATWQDDWLHTRGEPAATEPATVVGAAGYLERRMRWAANNHPAFDEFRADLRRIVTQLQARTSTSDRPIVAPAACFDCGGALVRHYRQAAKCSHDDHPAFPPATDPAEPPDGLADKELADWRRKHAVPLPVRRMTHAEAVAAWEQEHSRCDQGGTEDQWSCEDCDRTYSNDAYFLAVRAAMESA